MVGGVLRKEDILCTSCPRHHTMSRRTLPRMSTSQRTAVSYHCVPRRRRQPEPADNRGHCYGLKARSFCADSGRWRKRETNARFVTHLRSTARLST